MSYWKQIQLFSFFFFLHFSKTMPRPCLLGLGRGDCYCFTLRAVPEGFVSELAWFQGHCHSKQVMLRLPTCPALGCCKLWAEPQTQLAMNSYSQSTGAAVQGRSQAVPPSQGKDSSWLPGQSHPANPEVRKCCHDPSLRAPQPAAKCP